MCFKETSGSRGRASTELLKRQSTRKRTKRRHLSAWRSFVSYTFPLFLVCFYPSRKLGFPKSSLTFLSVSPHGFLGVPSWLAPEVTLFSSFQLSAPNFFFSFSIFPTSIFCLCMLVTCFSRFQVYPVLNFDRRTRKLDCLIFFYSFKGKNFLLDRAMLHRWFLIFYMFRRTRLWSRTGVFWMIALDFPCQFTVFLLFL